MASDQPHAQPMASDQLAERERRSCKQNQNAKPKRPQKYEANKSQTLLTILTPHCTNRLSRVVSSNKVHPISYLIELDREKYYLINNSLVSTIMS